MVRILASRFSCCGLSSDARPPCLAGRNSHEEATPGLAGACPCGSTSVGMEAVAAGPLEGTRHCCICKEQEQGQASHLFLLVCNWAVPTVIEREAWSRD